MVTAMTSKPSARRRKAAMELSTPPLSATATIPRLAPPMPYDIAQGLDEILDIGFGVAVSEADPQ